MAPGAACTWAPFVEGCARSGEKIVGAPHQGVAGSRSRELGFLRLKGTSAQTAVRPFARPCRGSLRRSRGRRRLPAVEASGLATRGVHFRPIRASVQPCTCAGVGVALPAGSPERQPARFLGSSIAPGNWRGEQDAITGECARVSRRLQKSASIVRRSSSVAVVAVAVRGRLASGVVKASGRTAVRLAQQRAGGRVVRSRRWKALLARVAPRPPVTR
jgi:hypothetical protein